MNPWLVGLAVAAVAGGVAAVAASRPRIVVAGVGATLAAGLLIDAPADSWAVLLPRLTAAALAVCLLWVVARTDAPTRGSTIGWPADALVAAAAGVAGAGAAGLAGGGPGVVGGAEGVPSAEALIAGFALAALSIGPLIGGRDALRVGVGLVLAITAASLVRVGVAGPAPALEQLAASVLVTVCAAATMVLATTAIRAGGGLTLAPGRPAGAHRDPRAPASQLPQPERQVGGRDDPDTPAAQPVPEDAPPADAPPTSPALPAPSADRPITARSAGTRKISGR